MKDHLPTVRIAIACLAAMALSACELRRDDDGEDIPGPSASATEVEATASPTPSESASPTESIIREDVAPVEPVEAPPEPFELTIPFPDGADVDARAERLLASVLQADALAQDWPVILEGHTDSSGNDLANLRASRARAEAVAAWLVERGVDDGRIQVIAFGEQNPVEPNALPDGSPNERGRRANRRVEVRIAPPVGNGETSPADESDTES